MCAGCAVLVRCCAVLPASSVTVTLKCFCPYAAFSLGKVSVAPAAVPVRMLTCAVLSASISMTSSPGARHSAWLVSKSVLTRTAKAKV